MVLFSADCRNEKGDVDMIINELIIDKLFTMRNVVRRCK